MDPLSITSAVIAIIQLTNTCLRLGSKYLGSSLHTPSSLTALTQELYCFNGAINSLQTYLEIHEEDEARLNTLACLEGPLRNCNGALCLLQERLSSSTFMGRFLSGRSFDRKLEEFLDILRKGRGLFEIVLLADQRTIISAIERYAINIAEDIRDLQTSIDTSGELMLDLSARIERHTEQAGKQHVETISAIQQLGDNLAQLRDDVARWNRKAERQQAMGWISEPNPSSNYDAAREKCQPETGEWLTNGHNLMDWRTDSSSFLWLHDVRMAAEEEIDITCFRLFDPDRGRVYPIINTSQIASPYIFYCASHTALVQSVHLVLGARGVDVQGGFSGNALDVASSRGHAKLLNGASVNKRGRRGILMPLGGAMVVFYKRL